jgi:hypothetical protein
VGLETMKKKLNQDSLFKEPLISISTRVICVLFSNQNDLMKAFWAVNMKYEKSVLNGKLKGLNMPLEFYQAHKSVDNEAEIYVWNRISDLIVNNSQLCYVIASIANDHSTLLHEYAHAYYYLNPDYQTLVADYYAQLEKRVRQSIEKDLQMRRYHPCVYQDEFQAYVLEDDCDFGKRFQSILNPIHLHFKSIIKLPDFQIVP